MHKVPNDYILAKSALINVGYTDCKSQINENIANNKMTCLIETAVLPGRHNKNRINIDR